MKRSPEHRPATESPGDGLDRAFDRWVDAQLRKLYDEVVDEGVPGPLRAVIERGEAGARASRLQPEDRLDGADDDVGPFRPERSEGS